MSTQSIENKENNCHTLWCWLHFNKNNKPFKLYFFSSNMFICHIKREVHWPCKFSLSENVRKWHCFISKLFKYSKKVQMNETQAESIQVIMNESMKSRKMVTTSEAIRWKPEKSFTTWIVSMTLTITIPSIPEKNGEIWPKLGFNDICYQAHVFIYFIFCLWFLGSTFSIPRRYVWPQLRYISRLLTACQRMDMDNKNQICKLIPLV